MSRRIGKANLILGDYRVREARALNNDPLTATWRVYCKDALDPISEHGTRTEARRAVSRYQAGDRRRA